jgi:hypothetical protein
MVLRHGTSAAQDGVHPATRRVAHTLISVALTFTAFYLLVWGSANLESYAFYLAEYGQTYLLPFLIVGSLLVGGTAGSIVGLACILLFHKSAKSSGKWLAINCLVGALSYSIGYIALYATLGDTTLRSYPFVGVVANMVRVFYGETLFGVGRHLGEPITWHYAGVLPMATGGITFIIAMTIVRVITLIRR